MMEPIARPLYTLNQVLTWEPTVATDRVRLTVLQSHHEDAPRVLVCHDMKGGYLEDSFIQGCSDCHAYRIVHWHLIDTFVYFSHHFITIPPPGWVDAAHRNGTKILGTLITEWAEGSERCKTFLTTPDSARELADKLVAIMEAHQFDGWLINIENKIEQVENLLLFVRYLTSRCHETLEHSQVIWYDSVTLGGQLDWQNELNEKNVDYFDACDGIFLNYTWKEGHLQRSRDFCSDRQNLTSTESDKDTGGGGFGGRSHDIYTGIDVYGRGCLGGGGFNCCEPLNIIKQYDLSVAVFAPGWTHEVSRQSAGHCHETEEKFWRQFETFPNVRRKLTRLPLVTSFCTGSGQKLFHHGEIISTSPWYNLSVQQLQPNLVIGDQTTRYHDDGYHGGGCLKITGNGVYRLFYTDIPLDPDQDLYVTFVVKPLNGSDIGRISMILKCDSETEPLEWEKENETNGWTKQTAVFKSTRTRLEEISFSVNATDSDDVTCNDCSYLIGYVRISHQKPVLTHLSNVTVHKLPPEHSDAPTSEQNHLRPFKVIWTSSDTSEHYAVLMQYMLNDQLETTTVDDVIRPMLLGHCRAREFVVSKLPETTGEWDAIELTIIPFCGNKSEAIVCRRSEIM